MKEKDRGRRRPQRETHSVVLTSFSSILPQMSLRDKPYCTFWIVECILKRRSWGLCVSRGQKATQSRSGIDVTSDGGPGVRPSALRQRPTKSPPYIFWQGLGFWRISWVGAEFSRGGVNCSISPDYTRRFSAFRQTSASVYSYTYPLN